MCNVTKQFLKQCMPLENLLYKFIGTSPESNVQLLYTITPGKDLHRWAMSIASFLAVVIGKTKRRPS